MKKRGISLILFFLLFMLFSSPLEVYAASNTTITKYQAYFDIKEDGSVDVTKEITYRFGDRINGFIYNIDAQGSGGIQGIAISEIKPNESIPYSLAEFASKGDRNKFTYSDSNTIRQIRIFSPADRESKTFKITYKMLNVVDVYNDTAQFNYWVLERGNETTIRNINILVNLPYGATQNDTKVFAHGNLLGTIFKEGERSVKIYSPDAISGEGIEARILFPTKIVPKATKIVKEDKLNSILAEEKKFADEANARREQAVKDQQRKEAQTKLAIYSGSIAAVLTTLFTALVSFRIGKEKESNFKGDYYRELPANYGPAVMSYLVNKRVITTKDLMATLLNLQVKNLITLEPIETIKNGMFGDKKSSDTIIRKKERLISDDPKLTPEEKFVYDWFTDELPRLSGKSEITFGDIESLSKSVKLARKISSKFDQFKAIVNQEGVAEKFFETNNSAKTYGIDIFQLLLLIGAGAFFIIDGNILAAIILLVLAILSFVFIQIQKYKLKFSQKGVDQYSMWMAFKKFLLTFSKMDRAELPSIEIWDHYLVYAVSLGVAKEVIKQLPQVYTMEEIQNVPTISYMPMYYGYNGMDRLDRGLSRANTVIREYEAKQLAQSQRSSSSGGGGGFSSGSSGGGGGGGGFGGTF